jgi:hypothetical protein
MPDITLPHTFVDGQVADADQASNNTYLPKLVPDNPEVINGRLTNPNRDGWNIDRQDVRRGHFSQASMVSATANQDFFDDTFKGQAVSGFPSISAYREAKVVPGCGISFYVPWTVQAVIFTWHVTAIVDAGYTAPAFKLSGSLSLSGSGLSSYYTAGVAFLMLFINDLPIYPIRRVILNGAATMSSNPATPGVYNNNYNAPDTRDWSGSFVFDNTVGAQLTPTNFPVTEYPTFEGWHNADIRLVFPANTAAGVGVKQVRVKTRRMGYTIIR